MPRDIDQIIERLRAEVRWIEIECLKAFHPVADEFVWFITRPGRRGEVQIECETAGGNCPFVISSDQSDEKLTGTSIEDVVWKVRSLWPAKRMRRMREPVLPRDITHGLPMPGMFAPSVWLPPLRTHVCRWPVLEVPLERIDDPGLPLYKGRFAALRVHLAANEHSRVQILANWAIFSPWKGGRQMGRNGTQTRQPTLWPRRSASRQVTLRNPARCVGPPSGAARLLGRCSIKACAKPPPSRVEKPFVQTIAVIADIPNATRKPQLHSYLQYPIIGDATSHIFPHPENPSARTLRNNCNNLHDVRKNPSSRARLE